MTNLKEKLKGTWSWIKENPKKIVLGAGLTALVATTALKDNVHFGSITLNNPQENQYTWGILPSTTINGNAKGNFYTFGLIGGGNNLEGNSQITGDTRAYGLFAGGNLLRENSQITGDMSAYSLLVVNIIKDNSQITGDMNTYGLIGKNNLGNNSQITGDMNTYGLIGTGNLLEGNSQITGDISNKGLFVNNDVAGFSFGSNDVKGLKNYVVNRGL